MRRFPKLLAVIVALTIGLLSYGAWLGYFGGRDLYVGFPAQGTARPEHRAVAAVLLSGDMGLRVGMGRQIAQRLSASGIPVLGVDSLVYFRHRRTAEEATQLLEQAIRRGLRFGHADRLVLIGQSYGADMVHVGFAGLPADLRKRLAMVVLVVPTDTVIYRVSPAETLDLVKPDAAAIDTGRTVTGVPLLCVQGQEEKDSLCPLLTQPNARRIALPGGHPLHRDADGLFRTLLSELDAVLAPSKGRA
ncbi:AcvB/VirJ family lysyl-phosphatidylglycerol hydrolase [Rhizorhabdus sp.]|jgi:type IV secretory pathway VirJ component|uniref:AcvB/VirJ family lysyl-phosphatidylglycerol hydrolase n=1 Tax=Rhizorhabdus sp. TaxID=1968843 RepID=UPI001B526AB1|nr:AcvB/VirJ family lysyl-phosphatidylglycerol hydrolase [Rhizorhabdus sp.]MBP8231731.1 type IV secretion system protein VirJ [Rhizorhabdus sp.]